MTPLEIILIILIILFVGGIIAWRVTARVLAKKGKAKSSGCGCGCSGCAAAASCPSARAAAANDDDDMPEISVQSEIGCDFSDIVAKMNDDAKI